MVHKTESRVSRQTDSLTKEHGSGIYSLSDELNLQSLIVSEFIRDQAVKISKIHGGKNFVGKRERERERSLYSVILSQW